MDAAEDDRDLQVQRASPDLLADIQKSLPLFLWRKVPSGERIRRRVKVKETDRIVALLEPFQELPQLLDPHLQTIVPLLADAFIASLQVKPSNIHPTTHTQLLIPLSRAICRLLYTICKIRGEKVIVRFLSTDTKHLELLLSAIEAGVKAESGSSDALADSADSWQWEERYITLLWLSQLLLAPFDLATISSFDPLDVAPPTIPGLTWPPNVPGVAYRVISLSVRYLSASGKERDAAKILLVRVAMRRDMQQLGVLDALVQWAISAFRLISTDTKSSYYYIGILAFLAGILNSSTSTSDMNPYLLSIFQSLPSFSASHDSSMEIIMSSVVARKTILKVLRNICAIVLRKSENSPAEEWMGIVENTIGVLFESLADSATPVRLAASKALSIITLKLPVEMAAEVVEEVINSLRRDVFSVLGPQGKIQDMSRVNPAEWHGLIITLSQLLYRRSPPVDSLSGILSALLTGLSFEQRSTSGASVGTNVRDAACFGIWALARRYTTAELQAISLPSTSYLSTSVLQALANNLVLSASLDPAGNIRRGSSAALQELIGRHPNTIVEGISVVQIVDYHAVALRSRAITDVASQVSQLSEQYLDGILDALLGWRGVSDADASSRRNAALVYGRLAQDRPLTFLTDRLQALKPRQDDERHGLLLCLAYTIQTNGKDWLLNEILSIFEAAISTKFRREDLVAEALGRLITASAKQIPGANNVVLPLINRWIRRNEIEVIDAVSVAALRIFALSDVGSRDSQSLLTSWINILDEPQGGRTGQDKGVLSVLLRVFPQADPEGQRQITEAIKKRWHASTQDIETRVAILKYMALSPALFQFIPIISDGLDDYTTNARGDVGSLVRIEAAKALGVIWSDLERQSSQPEDFILYSKILRLAAEKLDKVRSEAQLVLSNTLSPATADTFKSYSTSSKEYFSFLLDLQTQPSLSDVSFRECCYIALFEGYVGSADTGSEDLIRASRSALASFCSTPSSLNLVSSTLLDILKSNISNDRILVPTLEVLAFLFDIRVLQQSSLSWPSLYLNVQKAHFKTGNVKKLEAAVHVYGGLAEVHKAVLGKLRGMVLHPFPKIRGLVIDTLFVLQGVGKGINWLKAGKKELALLQ